MNAGRGMQGGNSRGTGARPRQPSGQVLRKLWRYLARYRWLIVSACLLSVVCNVLTLLTPKLSGAAIDAIIPGNVNFPVVVRYVILMVILAAVSAGLSWLLSAMMIHLSRSVVKQMRGDLFDHMTRLPVSFFVITHTSATMATAATIPAITPKTYQMLMSNQTSLLQ